MYKREEMHCSSMHLEEGHTCDASGFLAGVLHARSMPHASYIVVVGAGSGS